MKGHRITMLASQEERLRSWLDGHPDGHERGAIILFRRLDRVVKGHAPSIRFLAIDIIEMSGDWVIGSSPMHLKINLRKLVDVYFRCENEGLELGFAHNHPGGFLEFSDKDDVNERNILRGYAGSNGTNTFFIAMLLSGGKWRARARHGADPQVIQIIRHVTVLGNNITIHLHSELTEQAETLKRQEAAFGKPFNDKLQSLRVVVVGAGATGSAVATLVARSGVGELVIVDGDKLESTNLNRVRGYRAIDIGQNKAISLAKYISDLGLATSVSAIDRFLHDSPEAIDAVSSADVVFGCTDDVMGRDLLNQAAYYYSLAFIDSGLTGKIDSDAEGQPYLRDHRGRVSTILPEHGACLRCQRVITDEKLKYERALKERPELGKLDPETLQREYYLVGGGEQAPGVGPFTSATADNAVASLMNLIRPFRKLADDLRQDNIWIDFVHMTIHSNLPMLNEECFCCGKNSILLRAESGYRLDMPSLGRLK